MHRIAASLLIVCAVPALNTGMIRQAFAEQPMARPAVPAVDIVQPLAVRSGRVMTLLLVLEALRQLPVSSSVQKV